MVSHMRFGIFDHMEQGGASLSALYEERLQMLEQADELGFWCYHKAEHHFINLDSAPSANVFLAAASQRTSRLRFGPLVYLLPFYHPIRLLEEICALDNLCQGRLEIGVGKGISPPEHAMWGLDSADARDQFEEAFDILLQGLAHGRVDHDGAFYRFDNVDVNMRTYQGRMPGMWYPGNVEYAANNRLNTVVGGPSSDLAAKADTFRAGLATPSRDANPGVAKPVIAVRRHVYLATNDELALARVARAYPVYHQNLAHLWHLHNVRFPTRDPSFGGDMHAAMAAHDLVVGSPETVAAHIRSLAAAGDLEYLIASFAWGDLTHAESMASIDLFAREVMPRFS